MTALCILKIKLFFIGMVGSLDNGVLCIFKIRALTMTYSGIWTCALNSNETVCYHEENVLLRNIVHLQIEV